jgi:acyl carrier protein
VEAQVRSAVLDFIVTNFLFGDETRVPQDDDSLVEGGIIDSTGVMELIEFLESRFLHEQAAATQRAPEVEDRLTG